MTLTGALGGPNSVTISVNAIGLSSRSVAVTRPAFSPALLTGLALLLNAADASTITLDGSNNVSQWNDKSGNGRNVLQANDSQRPGYLSSGINGKPVLNFDGTDDFL